VGEILGGGLWPCIRRQLCMGRGLGVHGEPRRWGKGMYEGMVVCACLPACGTGMMEPWRPMGLDEGTVVRGSLSVDV
jgi:hypothetical protein